MDGGAQGVPRSRGEAVWGTASRADPQEDSRTLTCENLWMAKLRISFTPLYVVGVF